MEGGGGGGTQKGVRLWWGGGLRGSKSPQSKAWPSKGSRCESFLWGWEGETPLGGHKTLWGGGH